MLFRARKNQHIYAKLMREANRNISPAAADRSYETGSGTAFLIQARINVQAFNVIKN